MTDLGASGFVDLVLLEAVTSKRVVVLYDRRRRIVREEEVVIVIVRGSRLLDSLRGASARQDGHCRH